ncbi:unnamed protein product [Rotaria socialis]
MSTCLPQSTDPNGQLIVMTNEQQALIKELQTTETQSFPKEKNQFTDDQRLRESSSDSDTSVIKMKPRVASQQRGLLSSSSDDGDNDNEMKSTTSEDSFTASLKRSSDPIRIRSLPLSPLEDSNKNNETSVKDSEHLPKRRSVSNKCPKNFKKMKLEKRSSENTTSCQRTDNNKTSHVKNKDKRMKTKKTKLRFRNDRIKNQETERGKQSSTRRKNIRKIIDDKELNIETKNAIEAEHERRKRIVEKQKLYNDTLPEQSTLMLNSEYNKSDNSNLRLILEFDKKTNESIIEVSPKLVAQLKRHQCDGIKFLWNNVFESVEAIENKKQNNNGCILAHCMGLGKTLQVISFIHTSFAYNQITKVRTCLILSPVNAALNWSNEFKFWLKDIEPSINHYQLTTVERNLRIEHLISWYKSGGVLIMGYEMYRRLAEGIGIKDKKLKIAAYNCLVDPGPDIVVADEGHILKNDKTSIASCLSKIKTSRRIVLTGTPLQNNLLEYYCMVSFIKSNLLGDRSEYINRFVNPIQNGQHSDSNEQDVYLMKQRACVLYELLTGFVDRKDYSLLKEYLPLKFEYVINIRLSDLQSRLYNLYLLVKVAQKQRSPVLKKDFKSAKLFADYQYLQKIWTHPFLLYPYFIDRCKKGLEDDDDSLSTDSESENMFIDDNELETVSTDEEENRPELENNTQDEMDECKAMTPKTGKHRISTLSTTVVRSNSESTDGDEDIEINKTYSTQNVTVRNKKMKKRSSSITIDSSETDIEYNKNSTQEITNNDNEKEENSNELWLDKIREQFWFPLLDRLHEQSEFDVELSGKVLLVKFIIDKCAELRDKVLLFSRSLYSLNYIEKFLKHLHIQNEKQYKLLLSHNNNQCIPAPLQWILGKDYFRIDGRTKIMLRKRYVEEFNDPSNSRVRLFLISTQAGGIGINLTASNRTIIFDASWNPSHDAQALFRSYRFGQKKQVYIYRLVSHGTMEEKIYQRQVVKQSMSKRVIDDHQLDRHFTQADIKELYNFQVEQLPEAQSTSTHSTTSSTALNYPESEDRLLCDLLQEHSRWIHSYHSQDSLLENRIDESFSADERLQALEEYEKLKNPPIQRQTSIQRFPSQQTNSSVANSTRLLNIPVHARWEPNGVTIVGNDEKYNATNELYWPVDLFVQDNETVIFTDWANERVVCRKINSDNERFIAGGNGTGNRLDQLNGPTDVLIDKSTNSLIICDRGNRRVVRRFCRHAMIDTEILVNNIACRGLAMDNQGYLYIADYQKHVVKRYKMGDQNGTVIAGGNGKGNRLNQLNEPRYLVVDQEQTVFVSDSRNHRVVKWSKDAIEGVVVAGGRGRGKSLRQLSFPYGLFVDALGTVYVADSGNNRVVRWHKGAQQGIIVVGGNDRGAEGNQFNCPRGLSFDQRCNLRTLRQLYLYKNMSS